MTRLGQLVKRETTAIAPGGRRNIIIQLESPNIISFREKGRRQWLSTTVEAVYVMVCKHEADRIVRERKQRKREKA